MKKELNGTTDGSAWPDPRMMSVAQVSRLLNVSPGIIYREINRRRLSCYRIGGAIRVSNQQLRDYLEHAESSVHAAPATFKHVKRIGG